MQWSRLRFLAAIGLVILAWAAGPASARRTVIDVWGGLAVDGYCSPNECEGFTTPFSVQVGGTSYNTFYANSNGTLSFGSIWWPFLAQQTPWTPGPLPMYDWQQTPETNLAAYPVAIFSPNFLDGPGFDNADTPLQGIYDGNFVAHTSVTANSFTTSWYSCIRPQQCGLDTVDLVLNTSYDPFDAGLPGTFVSYIMQFSTAPCPCTFEEMFVSGQQWLADYFTNHNPMYTMTLTDLGDGFRVDYSYTSGALAEAGIFGFSSPSGLHQTTGVFEDRTYFFDSLGQLISVPEPQTWMTMLLGFGAIGIALRRWRNRQSQAAPGPTP